MENHQARYRHRHGHGRSISVAHPGYVHNSGRLHTYDRPLLQRLLVEFILLSTMAVLVLAAIYMQGRKISYSDGQPLVNYGINISRDPVQKQTSSPYEATIELDGAVAELTGDAFYSVNAKVEGIMPYNDSISPVAPYDLLLAWGEVAETGNDSKLSWEQTERRGQVSGSLGGASGPEFDADYVIGHVSNNHIIPANDLIRRAVASIQPGDTVRIEGRLVDLRMIMDDSRIITVSTSKSRTDQGDGACEIILVEHIRINDAAY